MHTYKSEEAVIKTRKKLAALLFSARACLGVTLGFATGSFLYALLCGSPGRCVLATILAFVALGSAIVASVTVEKVSPKLELFVPLAETSKCSTALQLIEYSLPAQKIRDEALAAGRQLYVFDYAAMRAAAEASLQELETTRNAIACRKLHNVTDQDRVPRSKTVSL
jgi:hypothetical protein